jgi:hypothetical protein
MCVFMASLLHKVVGGDVSHRQLLGHLLALGRRLIRSGEESRHYGVFRYWVAKTKLPVPL